jgi:hypothetical protein
MDWNDEQKRAALWAIYEAAHGVMYAEFDVDKPGGAKHLDACLGDLSLRVCEFERIDYDRECTASGANAAP